MLYPQQNDVRSRLDLSGFWDFGLDPQQVGESEGWFNGLHAPRQIAVPASWNELYPDTRDYLGTAWYAREFYVPQGWKGQDVFLRVGSANYLAKVWVNGQYAGEHQGGHLPFALDVTALVVWGEANTVAIQVDGTLTPTRVPPGNVVGGPMAAMGSYPSANFDFFPYTGIQRPVILYAVPRTRIEDLTVVTEIEGSTGIVHVRVEQAGGNLPGHISLRGKGGALCADLCFLDGVAEATLVVLGARLWGPGDPYLYKLDVALSAGDGGAADRYALDVGIRTIAVDGHQILLNGQPIHLTGFGRHEDFPVHGRGLNVPLIVKDYSLLKWIGANSYRTAHYPYSEEQMTLADREGLLVIDETPAVGLSFEDGEENIATRFEICKQQLAELVARDKNHPSVIMWSVANEPFPPDMMRRFTGGSDAESDAKMAAGTAFLQALLDLARTLDPSRPATLVGMMGGPVEWVALGDVACINRYWGWYARGGQIEAGAEFLAQELDGLYEQLGKPIVLTEFGADAIAGMHSDPPEMWSEEYQAEFLRAYLDVAAERPFVVGMHVWNFADFKTGQGSRRAGGLNLKGVFTRDRRPKKAAHMLRERWTALPAAAEQAPADAQAVEPEPAQEASFLELLNGVAHKLSGKHPGDPKTIGFDLGDVGTYSLVIDADGVCRVERGSDSASATLRMEAGTALKFLAGELNPMVAMTTGQVKVEGDVRALMVLASAGS